MQVLDQPGRLFGAPGEFHRGDAERQQDTEYFEVVQAQRQPDGGHRQRGRVHRTVATTNRRSQPGSTKIAQAEAGTEGRRGRLGKASIAASRPQHQRVPVDDSM